MLKRRVTAFILLIIVHAYANCYCFIYLSNYVCYRKFPFFRNNWIFLFLGITGCSWKWEIPVTYIYIYVWTPVHKVNIDIFKKKLTYSCCLSTKIVISKIRNTYLLIRTCSFGNSSTRVVNVGRMVEFSHQVFFPTVVQTHFFVWSLQDR